MANTKSGEETTSKKGRPQGEGFRFELNGTPSRNNKYSILLCITIGGRRKRIKTPIEVNKKNDFNPKANQDNWIRKGVPESKAWNETLVQFKEDAKKKYQELKKKKGATTSGKVAAAIQNENQSESFLEFAEDEVQKMLDAGKVGTWKNYNSLVNKLKAFQKKKDLLFVEIDADYISRFETFLHKLHNTRHPERVLHQNTIHGSLKLFKHLINLACKLGKMPDGNPFTSIKLTKIDTTKEKLDKAEIKALEALELEEGKLLYHTRDAFLLSFYCAGIRCGDLLQLRWNNISGNRLQYCMWKNNKIRDLVLVEQAESILKHYWEEDSKPTDFIFPFLNNSEPYANYTTKDERDTMPVEIKRRLLADISAKNALLNKELRKLAEMAGISKKVSMHISRHSFAKIAKEEGTDNSAIMNMMAHSSLTITEKYMGNFDTSKSDAALQSIFSRKGQLLNKAMELLRALDEDELASVLVELEDKTTKKPVMSNPL